MRVLSGLFLLLLGHGCTLDHQIAQSLRDLTAPAALRDGDLHVVFGGTGTLSDPYLKAADSAQADAMMDQWDEWARMEPFQLRGLIGHTEAIFRHHSGDRLEEVPVPALLLAGALDRLVPPANAEMMARYLPDAELQILQSCGHNIETERPGEMIDLIRDFIARREARRAASGAVG